MTARSIKVLYFAGLREQLGKDCEVVQLPESINTLQGLRQWIRDRGKIWAEKFDTSQRLMAAVNQEIAKPDTNIGDGDEVAFFPPVTGG